VKLIDVWWEENVATNFPAGSTDGGFAKRVTAPAPVLHAAKCFPALFISEV
jgi:hypothetical protein